MTAIGNNSLNKTVDSFKKFMADDNDEFEAILYQLDRNILKSLVYEFLSANVANNLLQKQFTEWLAEEYFIEC